MKWILVLAIGCIAALGCDGRDAAEPAPAAPAPPAAEEAITGNAPAAAATRDARVPRVVFLGDSLTAGLGVEIDQAFPAVVERMLQDAGVEAEIVNAGVSGDTTAGGLRRVDWLLRQKPDVVVVGLGGNDGLRGLDVKASEDNLRQIIAKAQGAGAKVLLLGMLIPPNYGPDYTSRFRDVYPRLARELNVPLVPFVLEGVGGEAKLNQRDGIHPTAEGHQIIAKNVAPHLRKIIEQGASKR